MPDRNLPRRVDLARLVAVMSVVDIIVLVAVLFAFTVVITLIAAWGHWLLWPLLIWAHLFSLVLGMRQTRIMLRGIFGARRLTNGSDT
jgi:hypothetical protein